MEQTEIINGIYQNSLKKFYETMKKINIESKENNMDYIKKQFNDILELINQYQNGVINIESIKLLNDISFNDFLKDKLIIETVSSNHTTINNSNIFIRKTSKFLDDDCSFYRIIELDGQYKVIKYFQGTKTEKIISLNELNSFISLYKVLNDSKFIGYSANQWLNGITILYSGKISSSDNYFTLYVKPDNTIEVCVSSRPYANNGCFQQIYGTEKHNLYVKSEFNKRCFDNIDELGDRAFIKVIEEQLNKQYGNLEELEIKKTNVLTLTPKNN